MAALLAALDTTSPLRAHLLQDHDDAGVVIAGYDARIEPPRLLAATPSPAARQTKPTAKTPSQAQAFAPFAPKVATRWDKNFFYVESDGLPDHRLMVGITAWQQQVPLPQTYLGENAWRFPLQPSPAAQPLSAKDHFFRGAIAIAANGVPIFNPIKNDGRTDTFLAGELDEFGGHAGRADDYHYHLAPLHLQDQVGAGLPLAYALDGYPLYGLAEPDGKPATGLDAFDGHTTNALGYHYHASKTYPYLNGGFHGEVTERDGQVDPQPRAKSVRPAQKPLRDATITDFTRTSTGSFRLGYRLNGQTHAVRYTIKSDGSVHFESDLGSAAGPPTSDPTPPREPPPADRPAQARQPWFKVHAKEMDANHDGTLTREELAAETKKVFAGYDHDGDRRLATAEYAGSGPGARSAMGGFLRQHAKEIDADGDGVILPAELEATAERMFTKTDTNHDGCLAPDELILPPGYQATPPSPENQNRPPRP
jgi:hypothetical protein